MATLKKMALNAAAALAFAEAAHKQRMADQARDRATIKPMAWHVRMACKAMGEGIGGA